MKYFVTGATGFVGGAVTRELRAAGHEVVALVRDPSRAADLASAGVTLARGDVTDKESMRAPMTGVDGVFHLAAWYKIGVRDARAQDINVGGTQHVVELMEELGVPRGVYTSTVAVFGDTGGRLVPETYFRGGPWLSEYDRTKWSAHYDVALPAINRGVPLTIVMPGVVYGPGDTSGVRTAFVQYLQGKLPATPNGTAYCWGHVEDTARGHLLAMERGRPGEAYNITGPMHSFRGAFELAERITGIAAPTMHPSARLLRVAAAIIDIVEHVVPIPSAYTAEGLRVVAGVTYAGSNEKAKRELGFDPRPFEAGLRETLAHEMRLLGMDASRLSTSAESRG